MRNAYRRDTSAGGRPQCLRRVCVPCPLTISSYIICYEQTVPKSPENVAPHGDPSLPERPCFAIGRYRSVYRPVMFDDRTGGGGGNEPAHHTGAEHYDARHRNGLRRGGRYRPERRTVERWPRTTSFKFALGRQREVRLPRRTIRFIGNCLLPRCHDGQYLLRLLSL